MAYQDDFGRSESPGEICWRDGEKLCRNAKALEKTSLSLSITTGLAQQFQPYPAQGIKRYTLFSTTFDKGMSTRKRVEQIPSLDPIEERLEDEIDGVNIIDELSISRKLRSQLKRAFNYHLQRRTLDGIFRSYTICFAVHLVAEGIFGYESGNYWGGTPLKKHGSQNDVRKGGQFFETFVDTYGLETFPDRPFRYVSLILLHSSIPNDVLPAFFEHALLPAVRDPEWRNFEPRGLIQRWPQHPPANNRLPKVAHTFFQNGGEVAVDFITRCLEMAERFEKTRDMPQAGEVRLPERVVESYEEWRESFEVSSVRRSRKSRKAEQRASLIPPQIWLDPWQAQIMVDLPEQELAGEEAGRSDLKWQIEAQSRDGVTDTQVEVHSYKHGENWKTESESVPLTAPARSYSVSLTGVDLDRTWTFEGLLPERQLLAFDGDTQEMIEGPRSLPARPLWLVYRDDAEMKVEGGEKIETDHPLHGPWEKFSASCWDLSSADSVQVGETTWTVVAQGQGLRPRLLEGTQLPIGGNRERYYTQLPEIRIPVPSGHDSQDELKKWDVRLLAETRTTTQALDSEGLDVRTERHSLVLPLNQLIDQIGSHEIGLRGPLGRSASFSFSYVGDCSLHQPEEPRIPTGEGSYPEKRIVVRTPSETELSCVRDDVNIESSDRGVHQVIFGETCTHANVSLRAPDGGSSVQLPLIAPGLQWTMKGERWEHSWSARPLRLSSDELEQSDEATLVVRNQPSSGTIELKGALLVKGGEDAHQRIQPKSKAAGQLRFDLLESLDLIRGVDRTLRLQLLLEAERSATLAHLEASLDVKSLSISTNRQGEVWNLEVTWETVGSPVRNRRLQLWSVGRPWESPRTFRISDDARGEAQFEEPVANLPPGPYIAALELEDPWREDVLERPSVGDPNATSVEVGSVAERLEHFWEKKDFLELKLEQAVLADSASDADRYLREASNLLTDADISMLLRSLWWFESGGALIERFADREALVSRWMREKVLAHPETFISLLTNKEFRRTSKNRLRSFMVELGTPQALTPASDWGNDIFDTAWQVWNPLGWMIEAQNLLDRDRRSVRRARNATGIRELIDTDDEIADRIESDSTPGREWTWKSLESNPGVFGGRPQEQQLSLPASVLREQRHRLDATLRGHFDDERSWQAVNFDWLLDYREDPRQYEAEVSVLDEYRETLRSGVDQISANGQVAEPVASGITDRYDPRPDAKLANVPFYTGATALIQRAYAIFEVSLPFVDPESLLRCGAAAFNVAGRLYERDVCLMSMAIEQQRRKA